MRTGLPSLTAMIVAGARAAADVDRVAARLAPPVASGLFRAVRGSRAARVLSLGLVDHLELRTRAIDDVVVTARTPQLVVLGAGLDARAFRLPELDETTVFEIDYPSTQAFKRERAEGLTRTARELVFVGVDFERDDLGDELARAGHDATLPTTWIWEGVTPYLTEGAILGTLDVVTARSAKGSVVAMTYGTPELGSLPSLVRPLVRPAFRVLGEDLRGLVTPGVAHGWLEARGFTVRADDAVADLASRYGGHRPRMVVAEHLLVAALT